MNKQRKWLDNYGKVDNANESDVSLPEGFVGLAYDTSGRKNSPAWGGQFQTGGKIPQAQDGILEKLKTNLNPYNWGVEDYTDKYPDKNKAFAAARKAGEKEYLYKGVRYPTTLKSLPGERIKERDDFKGGLFSYSASGGNRADSYGDNAIGDAYRYYGGLPLKSNELGISKYKPTSSTNPDARYVSIHNEQFLKDIETYSSIAFDDNKRKEFNDKRFAKMKKSRPDLSEADYEKIVPFKYVYDKQGKIIPNTYTFPTGSGTTGDKNSSRGLGNMFISKGKDDKGDYISYYDVFNKNTGKVTKETGEGWATKPYEIYDRIYFKDYGDGKQKRMYYSDKELSELDVNKKNFDTLALQRELSNRGYELTKSKKSDGNFDGVLGEETKKALEDLQNKKKSFATGGSIPGTPGFTYARATGSAPSEGKYAKKTMPSAQDGKTTVATSSPEYKQLYENRQIGRWLDDYNFDSQVPLDEVVVEGKRPSLYQDLRGVTKTVQELAAESTGIPGAIRFSENPKENIKGLIRTGDQTGLGLLGLLPGVEQTGFNYNDQDLEGAFNTLDTFGLVSSAAGLARKPIQKGLQQTGKYLTTQNPLKNTTVAKEFVPQMLEQINIDPIDDIIKNLEYGNKYRLKPEEKNFLDIIASGAESIDESLKSRIADLQSPKGQKRLIQQEKDYLQSIGFPKDDIDQQALINANARISELRNTNSINKNVDELYNKSIHVREKLQPFIDDSYLYDNAYAQVNPYNSMDNFNKSISSGSINLEKPVILGGQSLPGDIGIGMPFINSKPTEMHEIAHLLQRGRVLPIDKDARALIKPRVDLNETDAKAYKYFVKGSEKKEASAFLNELRESIYQRGIINNRLTDITPDILKKSYDEFKKNPSIHKFLKRDGVTPSSLSDHRILDFMEPDDLNFSNLSNLLNRLPSATLPIAGVATISSQTIEKKKQGGVIKDNRGQWDHPGEITEINSNYITMGPDPETGKPIRNKVLGVSNEGDTKLMLPGENYKFKGEKVTEYPLMQKGGRVGINQLDAQPKKKLNQLLNFTNNPDKNWLDNL